MVKLYETGVYRIRNILNGHLYIGGAYQSFRERKNSHFQSLRKNSHENDHLQKAFNKYKEETFIFEVIEKCSQEEVLELEQKWLNWLWEQPKEMRYNINPQARPIFLKGHPTTEYTRKKISKSLRKHFTNPENIKKSVEASLRRYKNPAEVERAAKSLKNRWIRDYYILYASSYKNNTSPELRAKFSIAAKERCKIVRGKFNLKKASKARAKAMDRIDSSTGLTGRELFRLRKNKIDIEQLPRNKHNQVIKEQVFIFQNLRVKELIPGLPRIR